MKTILHLAVLVAAIKGFMVVWHFSGLVAVLTFLLAAPVLPFIGFYAFIF